MVPSNWRLSGREDPDTFRTLRQGWVQSILHLKLDKQLKRYFAQQEHPSPPFTDDTIQIFREELIEFFVQHGVQLVWTIRDHQPMHLLVLQQFSELMQDHFLHLINGVVTVFIMRSPKSECMPSSVLVRFVFGGSFLSSVFPKTFWLKVAFLIGLLHFLSCFRSAFQLAVT